MQTSIHLCQNYGAFYDKTGAGITGPVKLKGTKNGTTVDLSFQQWTYQVSVLFFLSFPFLSPYVPLLVTERYKFSKQ